MPSKIIDIEAHFHSLYRKNHETGCWQWIGHKYWTGYGVFYIQRRSKTAHRVSYEWHVGAIPEGMLVLHSCDNRDCVNPKHLWLGKHQDNTRDCIEKGRFKVLPGSKNHNSKLTEVKVKQMRELRQCGLTIKELADNFGTSISNASRICNYRMWTHV